VQQEGFMRVLIIALLFGVSASGASATPPPPQLSEMHVAIAKRFWSDPTYFNSRLRASAPYVVRNMAVAMLATTKVKRGSPEWEDKLNRLHEFFWKAIEPSLESKIQPFEQCMARPYAFMFISELDQVDVFLKTDAGRKFWQRAGLEDRDVNSCLGEIFRYDFSLLKPEGWKLIGVKNPPKEYPVP
jgi:hypothetical protein